MTIPKKHCRLRREAVGRCLRFHLQASLNRFNVLRVSCCDFGLVDSLPLLESRDYHIALCVYVFAPCLGSPASVDRRSASDRTAPTMNDTSASTTALRTPLACRSIVSYLISWLAIFVIFRCHKKTFFLASMLADLELQSFAVLHRREILRLSRFQHFTRSSYSSRWWPRKCYWTPSWVSGNTGWGSLL